MKNHLRTLAAGIAIAWISATASLPRAGAQTPGFKRVELQRHDIAAPDREVVMARGEFQPGAVVPKHTHPGEEFAYVLSGELIVEIEGQPVIKVKSGDVFFVASGQVHAVKNLSKAAATVLSTYVVLRGMPLSTTVK